MVAEQTLGNKMTLKEAAQTVLDIQNGVNLHAILITWNRIREELLREVLHSQGTRAFNTHPINVMFAGKVAQLTEHDQGTAFIDAYEACKKLATE